MRPTLLLLFTAFVTTCAVRAAQTDALPKPAEVLGLMEKVADWQLANPPVMKPTDDLDNPARPVQYSPRGWVQAAGFTGIMALSEVSPKS